MIKFNEPISELIWNIKYRYKNNNKFIDNTIEDTWQRIAKTAALVEPVKQRKYWQNKFFEILTDFCFLPGGRIIAGAGTQRKVTLFNCFVMKLAEDSLPAIFDALKEGALTLQQGGGVGYDFSILRPRGQIAELSGAIASGPVSFMRIWDSMSAIMQSTGARRGAMMGTLRCDHPDIEEFIEAKSDSTQLRHFNVSVIVTDEFMQAVKNNSDWHLVFPTTSTHTQQDKIIFRRWSSSAELIPCRLFHTVKARNLWLKIIKSAYDYAEPGIIFEDTINRLNPLWYCEWISATNPCGEIPLPAYGACDLGSINLTQFVNNIFSKSAQMNWQKIENLTETAVRFLDNIITVSKYPLKNQQQMAIATRRIGLGFTGLADALVMLGHRYGDNKSLKVTHDIAKTISEASWYASIYLAKEKGKFPLFDKKKYLLGEFVKSLPQEMRAKIARYGIRNSHHNAIAPAGTISLLANNISNGIEPIFSGEYQRSIRMQNGDISKIQVMDYALRIWREKNRGLTLPPNWSDAQSLTPENHLQMQSVVQRYMDNAISKTINIPVNFPFPALQDVYTQAFELGLKGCTIFRPNPITGNVLEIADADPCCST